MDTLRFIILETITGLLYWAVLTGLFCRLHVPQAEDCPHHRRSPLVYRVGMIPYIRYAGADNARLVVRHYQPLWLGIGHNWYFEGLDALLSSLIRLIVAAAASGWALVYAHLVKKAPGGFPLKLNAASASFYVGAFGLLWYFIAVVQRYEHPPLFYVYFGAACGVLLLAFNLTLFFLSVALVNREQDQSAAEQRSIANFQPFTLSARFIEKYGITPRQKEVAEAALAGVSDKEIATVLGLSVNTVKKYLQTVCLSKHPYKRAARSHRPRAGRIVD
ncbi:MAG: LuxR C-terminal-related transcriptional regulator [Treponema sp.]|jgi:DNA-binding CsgD family transcriptional regulator|nr:LuxR C-terminal-related transcriptional regulator [Treponema sp.]